MVRILETTGEKPMRSTADALSGILSPSIHDAEIAATVHGLAAEFATLPSERRNAFLFEVRHLTTGWDRFRAARSTPPGQSSFQPLMALLDALIATDGATIRTDRGVFDRSELSAVGASISPTTVTLPVAYRNGETIYPSHRGPEITPFRTVRSEEVKRPASMWGDDE